MSEIHQEKLGKITYMATRVSQMDYATDGWWMGNRNVSRQPWPG